MDWYTAPAPPNLRESWNYQNLDDVKRKLITANHILHQQGVVDAYGHISIRCPIEPARFLMSGYMAPALVTSPDDLIEYSVKDCMPTSRSSASKKGYAERFIHGEIYLRFEDVNCVVHSHAEAVLPYVTSGVPLQPVFHMAGFLGNDVPVFDIAEHAPAEQQDLLVRDTHTGMALASKFIKAGETGFSTFPDHSVVLMRRHGFTTHGPDIETAVYRAIYTKVNAGVQTNAMLLRSAMPPGMEAKFELEPLTDAMVAGCTKMNEGTQDKPWNLWVAEVEKSPLYVNNG